MKIIISICILSLMWLLYNYSLLKPPYQKDIIILHKEIKTTYWTKKLIFKIRNNTWNDINLIKVKASFRNEDNKKSLETITKNKYFYKEINDILENWETDSYSLALKFFSDAISIDTLKIEY